MRQKVLLFALWLLTLPGIAVAASAPRTLRELAAQIVDVLTYTTATLVLLGLIIYMWGIASNILKMSEGEVLASYRNYVIWGIVIMFVMVSIWGILRLLQASVFGGTGVGMLPILFV